MTGSTSKHMKMTRTLMLLPYLHKPRIADSSSNIETVSENLSDDLHGFLAAAPSKLLQLCQGQSNARGLREPCHGDV